MDTGWNSERITAIVRLVVQVVSTAGAGFGLTVDADGLATIVLCVVAAASGIYNWWRNNNITKGAQHAQEYLDALKAEE